MVGTRKSKRLLEKEIEDENPPQEADDGSGSDSDDAPDEVTFEKSKKVREVCEIGLQRGSFNQHVSHAERCDEEKAGTGGAEAHRTSAEG